MKNLGFSDCITGEVQLFPPDVSISRLFNLYFRRDRDTDIIHALPIVLNYLETIQQVFLCRLRFAPDPLTKTTVPPDSCIPYQKGLQFVAKN